MRRWDAIAPADDAATPRVEHDGEIQDGTEPIQAWESVWEEWAFLPAENDQPSPPTLPPLAASTEPLQELFPHALPSRPGRARLAREP